MTGSCGSRKATRDDAGGSQFTRTTMSDYTMPIGNVPTTGVKYWRSKGAPRDSENTRTRTQQADSPRPRDDDLLGSEIGRDVADLSGRQTDGLPVHHFDGPRVRRKVCKLAFHRQATLSGKPRRHAHTFCRGEMAGQTWRNLIGNALLMYSLSRRDVGWGLRGTGCWSGHCDIAQRDYDAIERTHNFSWLVARGDRPGRAVPACRRTIAD